MATSIAAHHPAASVSLHPLASRDGQCSSTIVSVQVPQDQEEVDQIGSCHYSSDPRLLQEIQAKLDPHNVPDGYPQAATPRLSSPEGVNAGDLKAASYASLADASSHDPDVLRGVLPSSKRTPKRSAPRRRLPTPDPVPEPSDQIWGIIHDDIEQYPIIDDQPALCTRIEEDGLPQFFVSDDAPPIRTMTAAQFAQLHAQYNALDVPHSVVFPFLHGVDGDNVAQNFFFRAPVAGQPSPPYRGLTVVRADLPTPAQQAQMIKQQQQEQRRRKSASGFAKDCRLTMSDIDSSTGHSHIGSRATSSSGHCCEDKSADPIASSSSSLSSGGNGSRRSSDEESESNNDHNVPPQIDGGNGVNGMSLVTSVSNASFSSSMGSCEQSSGNHSFLDSYEDGDDEDDDEDDDVSRSESQTTFATSLASESLHDNDKGHRRRVSMAYNPQPDKCILNSSLYPYEIIVPPLMLNRKTNKTFHVSPAAMPAALQQSDCAMVETATFFSPPQNPGVNLRNFKIQAAKYATISDVVIYCPTGIHEGAITLAKWFREAQEACWKNRQERNLDGLRYNVFVITDSFDAFDQFPHLVAIDSSGIPHDRVDFVDREREEMQRLTTATPIDENVWLGCSADVPLVRGDDDCGSLSSLSMNDDESARKANPKGFSVCIECHDAAEIPDAIKLQHASHFLDACNAVLEDSNRQVFEGLQETSDTSTASDMSETQSSKLSVLAPTLPPRRDRMRPNVKAPTDVIYLECSSVSGLSEEAQFAKAASEIVNLCAWIKSHAQPPNAFAPAPAATTTISSQGGILAGALRSVQSSRHASSSSSHNGSSNSSRGRSSSASAGHPTSPLVNKRLPHRILLHCGDGYTETSILALAYLMYARGLSLPEAYLDLQERAKRSFFVYARDVAFLKKLEQYIVRARPKEPERPESPSGSTYRARSKHSFPWLGSEERDHRRRNGGPSSVSRRESPTSGNAQANAEQSVWQRGIAGLVSAAGARKSSASYSTNSPTPASAELMGPPSRALTPTPASVRAALTAAATASVATNEVSPSHAWFTHPRFEGAFPSRILPFLYLGNLNHALNPAMLHALGITHVVSVGESALHPPVASASAVADATGSGSQTALPSVPETEALNALWREEQAGRISVLDLKNVSDDGIDPLRSTMRVAVEYIEAARRSGGKVLVHCRVGVSRSTTIVLAYVMAHLDMSLVESYLLVRSRRLSILIQPHLLFFWELRGWETFVASQKSRRQKPSRWQTDLDTIDGALASDGQDHLTSPSLQTKKLAQASPPAHQATEVSSPIGASCGFTASREEEDAFDLDVDIGCGAGSPYGFAVEEVVNKPFGSGSPSGIEASALRLTWGFLCREVAALNERYF